MIGGFQYDITLGPYQQERLHAMTGTFIINTLYLWGIISSSYDRWIEVLYNTMA